MKAPRGTGTLAFVCQQVSEVLGEKPQSPVWRRKALGVQLQMPPLAHYSDMQDRILFFKDSLFLIQFFRSWECGCVVGEAALPPVSS